MLQMYPFSKNRYFPHKRMRAADFTREQQYIENKLAFLSRCNFGKGVGLGLEVQRIDSDSMLVTPGFAIDEYGHWLIVDEPAICRIRTLQGFDTLHGETALLWLAYHEELTDSMFVPVEQGEMQEYAVAQEKVSFYLTDMRALPEATGDRVLFSNATIFEDTDLRIRQIIPKILPAKGMVQLRLAIECFCSDSPEVSLHYFPDLPGLKPVDDSKPLCFEQTIRLEKGETTLVMTAVLDTTAQAVLLSLPERLSLGKARGSATRPMCISGRISRHHWRPPCSSGKSAAISKSVRIVELCFRRRCSNCWCEPSPLWRSSSA